MRQAYIPVDPRNSSIKKNIVSGSLWSGANAGFNALVSFIRSIILARFLAPSDFGIVAIAMVFTQFVLIFTNIGFTASVIYHRNLSREDISTCWWGNLLVDMTATFVCIGFALLSKNFVETPETPWIIVILSAQLFIASIGSINAALLQRMFKFKAITMIQIAGTLSSFIAIMILIIAFDMGVYGLAFGTVVGTICTTLLYFIFLPWLPSMSASFTTAKKHLGYGGWFLGVNLITYANGNLDKAIVGSFLDNAQLGYLEYASRLPSMVVTELGQILNKVLFSAFSSMQNDLKVMDRLLNKLFRFNTLIVYPMLFGLAAVASDFTLVLYGQKWEPIILPMQILCIYGIIRIFTNPLYALANGIGKPNMPFKWAALGLPLNGILLFLLVQYYGLEGVTAVKCCIALYFLLTLGMELSVAINASFPKLLLQALPAALCATIMAVCVKLVRIFLLASLGASVTALAIQVCVGVVVYIAALRLLYPKDIHRLINLLRNSTG